MDVGQDAAGRDGHISEEPVQLLVVADSELDVAGDDAGLFVVARGVARELEHFGGQVLKHSGHVHGGAAAHAGGVLAGLEEAADTAHGELQAGLGRPRGRLLSAAALSFSGHDEFKGWRQEEGGICWVCVDSGREGEQAAAAQPRQRSQRKRSNL